MFRSRARLLCDLAKKTNAELVEMMHKKAIPFYGIEAALKPDYTRAIEVRREFVKKYTAATNPTGAEARQKALDAIPFEGYDWSKAVGTNCENIVGYVPVPIGLAGPIVIDGLEFAIPMATTEGALVASTHRGARAINQSGGCSSVVLSVGMTRAPVIAAPSAARAVDIKNFIDNNFHVVKAAFDSTTRFGRLLEVSVAVAGRKLFLRFRAATGDAMGMNMVTKGVDAALTCIAEHFPDMSILALSGNYCTDKKPSAVNWIKGRGRSVVCEAVVKKELVASVLKTDVDKLVTLNTNKNLIGSAMAGSIGGFNAQAANVVAAVFLATGQDPAQVVESSMCLTQIEKTEDEDLLISVTMPSIEVGTIGGGTTLPAQKGSLDLIGASGSNAACPGANSDLLARVVAAGVLSAELSLMSGLVEGHLLRAHMQLNRKPSQ